MDIQHNGAARERVDFSKIKTSIPIPNLIEVQKKSYERFLQMDLLPNERDDIGSAERFQFRFPDLRFPRPEPARVRRLLDRQLGVQVRQPEGSASPAVHLPRVAARPSAPIRSIRATCSATSAAPSTRTSSPSATVRRSGRPAAEVRRAGVRRARHDLRRAAQGHHPAHGLSTRIRRPATRASATSRSRKSSSAKSR